MGLSKYIDAGVAFLPAALTFATVEARSVTLSSLALFASSGSFLWHGTPYFPIVGNLNYIANPGLASILDSTGPLALLVTSPKNIGK